MVDQDMKRRPLDGNAGSLEPDTKLGKNIVNEALIARVVCQPVHDVTVRMRGDRIDFWRRVHILLPSSDLDRRYRICRVPGRRRQWIPPQIVGLDLVASSIYDCGCPGRTPWNWTASLIDHPPDEVEYPSSPNNALMNMDG
jgi:hypothetical protein